MNRRGFLGSILALGAAPAIVRADSLMRIAPMGRTILWEGVDFWPKNDPKFWYQSHEFVTTVNRQYDAEFAKRKGDRLIIRMPNAYKVRA